MDIEEHLFWPYDADRLQQLLERLGVQYTVRRRWLFWRQFQLGPVPAAASIELQRFGQDVLESEQAW